MDGHIVTSVTDEQCTFSVTEYVSPIDRHGTTNQRCSTNLYVKNFPKPDFSEEDMK